MIDKLRHFNPSIFSPTSSDFNKIHFFIDTSVLLNLYRYKGETSLDLLKALSSVKDRLYIPYMVAVEFYANREKIILGQLSAFDELCKALEKGYQDYIKSLKSIETGIRHPSISIESIQASIRSVRDAESDKAKHGREAYEKFIKRDPILAKVEELFESSILPEHTDQKIVDAFESDAKPRYVKKIPPGFEDNDKTGHLLFNGIIYDKKYSDFVIWEEIKSQSVTDRLKNVAFVTDDTKDDWFCNCYETEDKVIRPELSNEIKGSSKVNSFYGITSLQLIKRISTLKKAKVKENILDEMMIQSQFQQMISNSRRLPYVVVHFANENRVAVYDRGYNLIREVASPELMNYAFDNNIQNDSGFSFTYPSQQPSWMTEDIKSKCHTYWLWRDSIDDSVPRR